MGKLTVEIHRSLRGEDDPKFYELVVSPDDNRSLGELIHVALSSAPQLRETCLDGTKGKAGILYIAGNAELRSLGLLDSAFDAQEDLVVKIVPVLHGG